MSLDLDPNYIFRDFVTDGIPASGKHDPRKVEIRQHLSALRQAVIALIADADPGLTLPNLLIRATDEGEGSENAIQATTNLPIPAGDATALIALNIFEANTGSPVTVSFNGGPALTIKTNSGNDVSTGGLAAGMVVLGYVSDSTFRIVTDQVSAAIVAAAEAAAERAEDAAASLDLPSFESGDAGMSLFVKEGADGYELRFPTFRQAGDGAVVRSLESKIRERVSVADFRQALDANWTVAFTRAIDHLKSIGGGLLHIPAGIYDMGSELVIKPASYWHNLVIEGDGSGSTILDFQNADGAHDGLVIEKEIAIHGKIGLRGFAVRNSPGVGIYLNRNGEDSFLSQFSLEDVRSEFSAGHGVVWYNTYMGLHVGLMMQNNGGNGARFLGFHTSLTFDRCWAGGDGLSPLGGNGGAGWDIENIVYSKFVGCGADWNGLMGWRFRNMYSTTVENSGAESNAHEGFLVDTSIGPVKIALKSILSAFNSKGTPDGYASLLGVVTSGTHKATIDLELPSRIREHPTDTDIVVNGAGGTIDLIYDDSDGEFSFLRSGSHRITNRSVVGRSALASLSGNQSISNVTDTAMALTVFDGNTLGAWFAENAVVIPPGVHRVKVTAGAFFDANTSGHRTLSVRMDGGGSPGLSGQKVPGAGYTPVSVQTAVISVNPAGSNVFGAILHQDSGGMLSLVDNGSTFLSVEAIG